MPEATLGDVDALLLDMDDTILVYDAACDPAWEEALIRGLPPALRNRTADFEDFMRFFTIYKEAFWSDPERHRRGRLDLAATRAEIVRGALEERGLSAGEEAAAIGKAIALDYGRLQAAGIRPFPGAIEALKRLRSAGLPMALLTNGEGPGQRAKIERFGLGRFFEIILVEGEFGAGKPDPRIFLAALAALGVPPERALMAGDNPVWDVAGAQACGIRAVLVDPYGRAAGRNGGEGPVPAAIVRGICEIPGLIGY